MADKKADKAADSFASEKFISEASKSSPEDELKLENALLKEENVALKAQLDAFKAAMAEKAEAKKTGAQLPHALMYVLGKGRRDVLKNMTLLAEELEGLVEDVHYELR